MQMDLNNFIPEDIGFREFDETTLNAFEFAG